VSARDHLFLRPHSAWSVSLSGFEDDYSTRSCSCPFSLIILPGGRTQASRSSFLAANLYHQHRRVGCCLSADVKNSRMDGLPSALSETQLPSDIITPFSHGFSTAIHFQTIHPLLVALLLGFSRAHLLCPEVCDCVPTDDCDCTERKLSAEDCK
jgi:hypothetical protein